VDPLIFRISPSARLREKAVSVLAGAVGGMGFGLRHAKKRKIRRRYLLDDPMLDGVAGKLGIAVDGHFFHDVVAVVAKGIFADREPVSDFRFADTHSKEGEDLKFPIGKDGVGLSVVLAVRRPGDPIRHQFGMERGIVFSTAEDEPQDLDDLAGFGFLVDIGGGAIAKHSDGVNLVGVHAKDDDWKIGPLRSDHAEGIEGIFSWHGDVEDDEVVIVGSQLFEEFLAIAGFFRDGEIVGFVEDELQTRANDGVVIGDDDSIFFHVLKVLDPVTDGWGAVVTELLILKTFYRIQKCKWV
jgi:hypothetical protein